MSKYIDADKLQETVYKRVNNPAIRGWLNSLINEQPTADVKEVKHGQWSPFPAYKNNYTGICYECTECGCNDTEPTNFCSNCGARMDGGVKE